MTNLKDKKIRSRRICEVIILTLLLSIIIIPQIVQQFILDKLPATGDMIHKRMVYLITNYPDFHNVSLLQEAARSKLYHYYISYFNIIADLTGENTFYGFGLINLLSILFAVLTILIFIRRLSKKYTILSPIFFLASPLLIFPFLGQADQHLTYIYTTLFLFLVMFFPPKWKIKIPMLFFIGAAFNSSFVIWLPLMLILFFLEFIKRGHTVLILSLISILLYYPLIQYPLVYLSNISSLVILVTLITILLVLVIFRVLKIHISKYVYIAFSFFTLIALVKQDPSGNLYINTRYIQNAKEMFSSVSFIDYIFSINPNKFADGNIIYTFIVILFFVLTLSIFFFLKRQDKHVNGDSKVIKYLIVVILIPLSLSVIRYIFLKVNFEYFIKTPIAQLHTGRINALSLFICSIILPLFFVHLKFHYKKIVFLIITVSLIANITYVGISFFNRTYQNGYTQRGYQSSMQKSIEEGDEESISYTEALYSCHYYNHCDIRGTSDISF